MSTVERIGMLAGLRPERADEYRRRQADPPAGFLWQIGRSNLRNYSIFEKEIDGRLVLFNFSEYHGACLAGESVRLAADPAIRRWRAELATYVEPMPLAARRGQLWDDMEEVFYGEGATPAVPCAIRRIAAVTGLKPEREERYRMLHSIPWPGVVRQNRESNLRKFTIFLKDIGEKLYLFYYLEYVGADFEADMKAMAENPVVQRWWKLTDDCQIPLPDAPVDAAGKKGPWTPMTEIFHAD